MSIDDTPLGVKNEPRAGSAGAAIVVCLALLTMADMAVETILAGSKGGWWIGGMTAAWVGLLVWLRRQVNWVVLVSGSLAVLLGLFAVLSWVPLLGEKSRAFGQPLSTVLSLVTACAIGLASLAIIRVRRLPPAARYGIAVVAVYGVAAFVMGTVEQTPYSQLFHGAGLWRRLPAWLQGSVLGGAVLLPIGVIVQLVQAARSKAGPWGWQQTIASAFSLIIAAAGLASAPDGPSSAGLSSLPSQTPSASQGDHLGATERARLLDLLARTDTKPWRATFDVAAVAAQVGGDVDRIFAFVRDDLRCEVYQGVLRGARGALMARAGNSFDKSMLLASLLRHHGHRARFVRGRLGAESAQRLIARMFQDASAPQRERRPSVDGLDFRSMMPEWRVRFEDRIQRHSREVETALTQAGLRFTGPPMIARESLVEELADHLWIEYESGEAWIPLDPSFKDALPGQSFAEPEDRTDEVLPGWEHRVLIAMIVEERDGTELRSHPVLQVEKTAAELNAAPVLVANVVRRSTSRVGWSVTPLVRIDAQIIRGNAFPPGQTDLTGGEATHGLRAAGELFGAPKLGSPAQITAIWLDFTFTTPSGSHHTVRRELLDRIGPVARSNSNESVAQLSPLTLENGLPRGLGGVYACSFTTGEFPPVLLLDRISRHLDATRRIRATLLGGVQLSAAERQSYSDELVQTWPDALAALAASVHAISYGARQPSRTASGDVHFYDAAPRLAIVSVQPKVSDSGALSHVLAIDLRQNDMRAVTNLATGEAARANFVRGIMDSVIEHDSLRGGLARRISEAGHNTVAAVERHLESGGHLVALRSPEDFTQVRAPAVARARMINDLKEGVMLVAPSSPIATDGREGLAWWRVNLTSGETLGVADTGLHQDLKEEVTIWDMWGEAVKQKVWADAEAAALAAAEPAASAATGWFIADTVAWNIAWAIAYFSQER